MLLIKTHINTIMQPKQWIALMTIDTTFQCLSSFSFFTLSPMALLSVTYPPSITVYYVISCISVHSQAKIQPKNLCEVSRGERPLSGLRGVLNPATLCLIRMPDATLPVHYKKRGALQIPQAFFLEVPEESFTLSRSSQPTDHRVLRCLCKVMKRQDPLNYLLYDCRPALTA